MSYGSESAAYLGKLTGYDFSHAYPTPMSDEEIAAKMPKPETYVSKKAIDILTKVSKIKEVQEPWRVDNLEVTINGMKTSHSAFHSGLKHKADPELMDRVERATDKNVQLQNRFRNYGTSFDYRLFCTRCQTQYTLNEDQVKSAKGVHDDIIVFAIKHRHDGGGGSIKVLSTFANVVASEAEPTTMPASVGRVFREEE